MTTCRLKSITDRIHSASESSPMLVSDTDDPGIYDCCFANTVAARQRVSDGDPMIIGIYYGLTGVADLLDNIGVENDGRY
jgi:hypothetical protein